MKVIDAKFSGQGDDFAISGTVQMSNETGLLPCPFCGATPRLFNPGYHGDEINPGSQWDISCGTPGCFLEWGADWLREKNEIVAIWNTRAPQILELTARVSGNTIELSGVPQVTGNLNISWELVGEVDNA